MKNLKNIIVVILAAFLITAINYSCSNKKQLKSLIVTGQNNHNWEKSSMYIRSVLENTGIFSVNMKFSPKEGKDMSGFIIDFSDYDVVVLDYTGDEWPDATKQNFVSYVENGGGVVVYHAANNAFPDWPEFNEIIGLGGWGNRDEKSGPYVYIKDGEVVHDNSPGRGGSHGRQHEFLVEARNPEHPILKGLPEKWLHTKDELYSELRGPAKNLEVLAFAHASKKTNGTGRNEPVLMTISYGKGRIFHTVMGHAGNEIFPLAMESAGFITTLQRGAEWAATGKVTQAVPKSFPTETESLAWKYLQDTSDSATVVSDMQNYETSESNYCFFMLRDQITESLGNDEKMAEIHDLILQLLKSKKTSVDCKKVLCKDFSWIATNSYIPVYEKLKQNKKLKDNAQYALEKMGN